jgi:phosphate transport system substrate-binding protein
VRPAVPTFLLAAGLAVMVSGSAPAGADNAPANGQGSTYAALAFQQWTQSVQSQGLNINYTPTNSPAGLNAYAQNTADFAGTEAEFSELTPGAPYNVPRGFEYTPDVAGATAIMYNVALSPTGQDPVNYLHLSPLTISKIFVGKINNWDDPSISEDNKGLVLPNEHITVVCRTGQSGTTALFYDFVAHTDPSDFTSWAQQNGFSTSTRVIEIDNANAPTGMACQSGSDSEASYIANNKWTIGYDEFAYAKTYNDNVAWVQNASGNFVQPYADNISAALQSAQLAPDTSQNLTGVYSSPNPAAYPISAYSYILVQCAPSSDRPTCVSPYANGGVANTLSQFMTYVACPGQVHMAEIGYAPLPPQLSQFLADAVGRMLGQPAQQLNASNCSNPTFGGGQGQGAASPHDPTAGVASEGPGPGSGRSSAGAASAAGTSVSNAGGTTQTAVAGTTNGTTAAQGTGRSSDTLPAQPVVLTGTSLPTSSWIPLLALLLAIAIPAAIFSVHRRRRAVPAAAATEPGDSELPQEPGIDTG